MVANTEGDETKYLTETSNMERNGIKRVIYLGLI